MEVDADDVRWPFSAVAVVDAGLRRVRLFLAELHLRGWVQVGGVMTAPERAEACAPRCDRCNGTGYSPVFVGANCLRCDGTGRIFRVDAIAQAIKDAERDAKKSCTEREREAFEAGFREGYRVTPNPDGLPPMPESIADALKRFTEGR
jgi:hypothetical protein